MKKLFLVALCGLLMTPVSALADEGMWLLPFLKDKNIQDMKRAGFKLSAEDIYSVNKHALKDAIVIFGGGCTGEVISSNGLILTNHHCGYGTIQSHSTVENDYLQHGFWAQDYKQEIPSPGLAVTFIRKIVDVTPQIMEGTTEDMNAEIRDSIMGVNYEELVEQYKDAENKNIRVNITPMFGGNQFILFVQERFGDVRLVGAPPSSIGKYGGDTDNWMWPRHTGDFALFRIYANADNGSTADYEESNVPYKAPKHLTISTKGIKKGDFAMIMGFPGSTDRYMTTWEIDEVLEQDNPIRIFIRGEKQKIWWEDMLADPAVRIQYANKYAGSSNYWKNSIGMSRGLKRLNVRDTKQADQDKFMEWVNADPARIAKYGDALATIETAVRERRPAERNLQIVGEVISGAEAYNFARNVYGLLSDDDRENEQKLEILKNYSANFFKNYNAPTDKKATLRLFEIMADSLDSEYMPEFLNFAFGKAYSSTFDNSPYTSQERFNKILESEDAIEELKGDPLAIQAAQFQPIIIDLYEHIEAPEIAFEEGHKSYLAGLLEMNKGKKEMYPDANFTIRLTYGNVLPYKAADAVTYDYITTLGGVIEKHDEQNPDFVLPQQLIDLYEAKDFGRWAVKGDVPVAFISDNDITGGNSGSPVLNGRGELIGLAFDGNWEAMSGDIAFEPELQRTISVDIRYVLFIIDKYAGAQRLIDEMTIK